MDEHILGLAGETGTTICHQSIHVRMPHRRLVNSQVQIKQSSYQGLNHQYTLRPHVVQELVHIDRVLSLYPLQHAVQQDEGARPPHTGAAVDQQREAVVFVVSPLHTADERDEGGGKLGHSVVRPGGEVILCHTQGLGIRFISLYQGKGGVVNKGTLIHP